MAVLASAFFERGGIRCILPPLGMLLAPDESNRCELFRATIVVRDCYHSLYDAAFGIVGDCEQLLLLTLPPFGALGNARRLGCAEVTRERVRIARGRCCFNPTPPTHKILEEECAVQKPVQRPESPERAPPEPALHLCQPIPSMLLYATRSRLCKDATAAIGMHDRPHSRVVVRV